MADKGFDPATFPWGEFFGAQRGADIGLSLGRIEQNVSKFSGEKPMEEPPIEVWLDRLEKRCDAEKVSPEGVISFLVCGAAREVFETLNMAEAKDWTIVKELLSRSFGLIDKAAFDRYRDRKLGETESVDAFVGDLKRCATQVGISHDSKGFRLQLLNGLPRDVEMRLSEKTDKFTKNVRDLVSDIREEIATHRTESVGQRSREGMVGPSIDLRVQRAQGSTICFRCQGKGHFARDCTSWAAIRNKRSQLRARKRTVPRGGCWICLGDHFVVKCPQRNDKSKARSRARIDPVIGTISLTRVAVKAGGGGKSPLVQVCVGGKMCTGIVDTGAERSMMDTAVVAGHPTSPAGPIITADGRRCTEARECMVPVGINGYLNYVNALVMPNVRNLGVDCLLGSDVIDRMGGVTIRRGQTNAYDVIWGRDAEDHVQAAVTPVRTRSEPSAIDIDDVDFKARFRGGEWTVSWRWTGSPPATMQTRIGEYKSTQGDRVREKYDAEIASWIEKGWLVPWNGPVKGVIPLMAVEQPTKAKVRPVLDFRELNEYIECHTGDDVIAVCGEKIRKWRQEEGELALVDLRSAYLQIHVEKELWQYQIVRHKGKTFALTRLAFGMSSSPRIMTAILRKVLDQDERVKRGTDHYIDDILVARRILSPEEVRVHLQKYGLVTKEPENLDGGRVLGIAVKKDTNGVLQMSRGAEIPTMGMVGEKLTKRGLFSVCGKLTGHYPIAGWLRPCCSYLKRLGCKGAWDDGVDNHVKSLTQELVARATEEDPVKGQWHVPRRGQVVIWTDASSLAMGAVLEVDGRVVEDASWLRKQSDVNHINVAELEAASRGVKLAIEWGFREFTLATDSRTVVSWLSSAITCQERVKSKSAAALLIKRRLATMREMIDEFQLKITVKFVSTAENLADVLTRVPKRWLGREAESDEEEPMVCALAVGKTKKDAVWAAHLPHHLGVDRTTYLARQIRGDVTKVQVRKELAKCDACARIDPALRVESKVGQGELAVKANWRRLSVDVTHYKGNAYLSVVDCGPARFAIWRKMKDETARSCVTELRSIMLERGPCDEILLDNATAFHSGEMGKFADSWGISLRFRAANAPSGNGIVERNHRTVKRMAERGGISIEEAVYWYNVTPRRDQDEKSVPATGVSGYKWRVPYDLVGQRPADSEVHSKFKVGDAVYVRPANATCTEPWSRGRVTRVVSKFVVEVDGMARHVRHLRKVPRETDDEDALGYGSSDGGGAGAAPDRESSEEESSESEEEFTDANETEDEEPAEEVPQVVPGPRRGSRARRRPDMYGDWEYY